MMKFAIYLSITFLFTSCYAPPQEFKEGSKFYEMANPKLNLSENQLEENSRLHQVIVAVLDGGIDYNNVRFQKQLQLFSKNNIGYDLLGNDYWPSFRVVDPEKNEEISEDLDVSDHGTHVSTLATLDGNFKNADGVKKRFSDYIGLLPIRILPFSSNSASPTENADVNLSLQLISILNTSINLCLLEKVSVINLSIGADLSKLPEEYVSTVANELNEKVIRPLKNEWKDILFVVAAGNESKNLTNYLMSIPATLKSNNLISVGALKDKENIASFSNYGDLVDVYIRGEDINSNIPGNIRKKLSGTSMASPLVANLATKIKVLNKKLSAQEIKSVILNSADELELRISDKGEQQRSLKVKVVNFKRALTFAYEGKLVGKARN